MMMGIVRMMVLVSRITAPIRVSRRPSTNTPVWMLMETAVRNFPAT